MKQMTLVAALLLIATASFAQLGVLQPQPQPPQQPLEGTSSDAPIGARDVLEIKVFQDPSLNTRTVVTDDGKITVPLVGKMDVTGLRPVQLEQAIKQALEAKYMQKADVTVLVVEAGNRPISVIGAVTRPGRISATGNITLMQAITQAGGLGQGYGKYLYVLRTASNGLSEQLAIDIEDLMVNGNPDLNVPLRPNDVVNVPVDQTINIYLLGEVMKPGKVQFRRSQSPTLLQALADAGGPTDRASSRCVIRRKVNGAEKNISVDFKKILNGKAPDVPLQDDDTIYVRESTF
jgi:polysaccharide export outer membrane protein